MVGGNIWTWYLRVAEEAVFNDDNTEDWETLAAESFDGNAAIVEVRVAVTEELFGVEFCDVVTVTGCFGMISNFSGFSKYVKSFSGIPLWINFAKFLRALV